MVNETIITEQVERRKARIEIEGKQDRHGIIRLTTASPPHKPELRLSFTPFEKTDRRDKRHSRNCYTSSYIVTSRESAELLSATFLKAAEMVDESKDNLPSNPVIFTRH